jgi:phosphoesterase RecJ-like protein
MMDRGVFRRAGERVAGWKRTMVLSHARPDGDALGAIAAMTRVIRAAGRLASGFVYDVVPPRYQFLEQIGQYDRWQAGAPGEIDSRFDGILILDTCSWAQLEPVADYIKASRLPKVVVDHHATRDDLSKPRVEDIYVIDVASASDCGMVYEWCEEMGWPVDCEAGEAIWTGMAADTGWFRFSNTDGRTLRAAAALIERCNLRPDILYAKLNASHSPARLGLMARMLNSLTLHANGAIAVAELTREMFEAAGAGSNDAEELVNEPMSVGTVIVSVLLTDMGDGVVRVNLRSKSPELVGRDVNVAAVARQFGGGGHHRAAGARLAGSLPEVKAQVLGAVCAVFN